MIRDDIHNAVLLRNAELRIIQRRLEESKRTLISYHCEDAARHLEEALLHITDAIDQNIVIASTIKEKV